ncbi:hypothetical protein DIS24_g8777 [Lasiodiplodia hormozganensis]|uniref:Uncharacterized protein n=2 Tax=Lasiodiplodia TaxID=66739 RepID=A0A5N5DS58_9PEZI|nr:Oxoglutarate iron-dependent oxygenase [Lasiodiplodia theobromae]KAB2580201.1 hypothetical protein DBV05_g1265 [Lasiodiplodia theobromae]KAF4542679.1 Oxoglutarate iron-dependent oxygenase [Lasiodiplodia theobromae]KAK0642697.1 hypothetical protein DIS24_g8777 [Lasiodiplodia hormozganensis]
MRVLVAFHFTDPPFGRIAWQTDVLNVSLESTYEDFICQILQLQQDLSHFLGEDWTATFPFHVMWLSRDHHGKLPDVVNEVPPFQSHLRKGNWQQILLMMQQRGFRDVICVEIASHAAAKKKPAGWELEREAVMKHEAEWYRKKNSLIDGQASMATTVEDSP